MDIGNDYVTQTVVEVVTWTLFGIAIVAATIRTSIRVKSKRRLFLDDVFLIFARLALTATSAILQKELDTIYPANETVRLYLSGNDLPGDADVGSTISRYQALVYGHGTLGWLAVFSVKFSFLSFFRQLVHRIPRLYTYWWTVVIVNIAASVYCLIYVFAECPHTRLAALQCLDTTGIKRAAGLVGVGIGVDIITDILIISIPTAILWQVRLRFRQKLGIGVSLCLSVCMIGLASTRLCGIILGNGSTVGGWQYFWLEIEASVAVLMISLTAFRSVFADRSNLEVAKAADQWYSSTVARNVEPRKFGKRHDDDWIDRVPSPDNYTRAPISPRKSWLGLASEGSGSPSDAEPLQSIHLQAFVTHDISHAKVASQTSAETATGIGQAI